MWSLSLWTGISFSCASTAMEQDRSFWNFRQAVWSEETGYAGSKPVFLCKVAPNAACISNFAHCYLITDCKKVSSQHLDATEDLEIVVMSAEETKKLMAEGGLVQAVHVAAMYYAEKLLNK